MNVKKICMRAGLALLMLISVGDAWGRIGHEVVAAIAYDHLTPTAKRRVQYYNHALKPVYGELSVIKSAAWPDWLRSHDIDVYASWHYIDDPYVVGNVAPPPVDHQNIVWAIEHSETILKSRHANAFEKGLFLRFLMHMMGDVHQPLHCITRVTPALPHGDRGGNDFLIPGRTQQNLHQVWDGAVGLFAGELPPHANDHDMTIFARRLAMRYPPSPAALSPSLGPADFAKESYQLAKTFAYHIDSETGLSRDYKQQGQVVAAKQLVLAGYRLAAVLNQIFQ